MRPLDDTYVRYKIGPCGTVKYPLAWPLAVYETAALPLSYAGFRYDFTLFPARKSRALREK